MKFQQLVLISSGIFRTSLLGPSSRGKWIDNCSYSIAKMFVPVEFPIQKAFGPFHSTEDVLKSTSAYRNVTALQSSELQTMAPTICAKIVQ